MDELTDEMVLIVLCFPIAILWKVRVSMRKKVMLSAVFGMVLFTIAVTIVRGAISGGLYRAIDDDDRRSGMDLTWECVTFWFHMELTVGEFLGIFLVAVRDLLCLLTCRFP